MSQLNSAIEEHFERFWSIYPKREGSNPKKPALQRFKAVCRNVDPVVIIAGATAFANDYNKRKIDPRFIPMACRWLREYRWEEYQDSTTVFSEATTHWPTNPQWPIDDDMRPVLGTLKDQTLAFLKRFEWERYINEFVDGCFYWTDCESPIEEVFYVALQTLARFSTLTLGCADDDAELERVKQYKYPLIVQQQAKIGKYRVDFLIHFLVGDEWKSVVVECDGHDYHERTKEQAAYDRSRDRAMTLMGYTVLRFTGSEIWNDPFGCAAQIIEFTQHERSEQVVDSISKKLKARPLHENGVL